VEAMPANPVPKKQPEQILQEAQEAKRNRLADDMLFAGLMDNEEHREIVGNWHRKHVTAYRRNGEQYIRAINYEKLPDEKRKLDERDSEVARRAAREYVAEMEAQAREARKSKPVTMGNVCPECKGRGAVELGVTQLVACDMCNGSGRLERPEPKGGKWEHYFRDGGHYMRAGVEEPQNRVDYGRILEDEPEKRAVFNPRTGGKMWVDAEPEKKKKRTPKPGVNWSATIWAGVLLAIFAQVLDIVGVL